jgi:spore coat protein U-like protein
MPAESVKCITFPMVQSFSAPRDQCLSPSLAWDFKPASSTNNSRQVSSLHHANSRIQIMQNSFMKSVLATALVAAVSTLGGTAEAGTATNNLPISATVAASCVIDASGGVAFGTYDPIVTHQALDLDATGTIDTTCTTGSAATITLGQGVTPVGGSTAAAPVRQMNSGADHLLYQLYSDAGHSTVWDDVTGVSAPTGTGAAEPITVYGRVPQNQSTVPTGSYTDTVVATVTF